MNQEDFHPSLRYVEEHPELFNTVCGLAVNYLCALDTTHICNDSPL